MKSIHPVLLQTILLLFGLLLIGCQTKEQSPPKEAQRYVWVTGLDPDKAEYYEELHANPWPEVTAQITASNIQNFSIHKREIEGQLYLIAYLEYVGEDFEADMAKMAEDEATQRWWKETDPCQIPLPDAAAKGAIWADTEEVFYLP
jgi:L-rhamnose mutarotase